MTAHTAQNKTGLGERGEGEGPRSSYKRGLVIGKHIKATIAMMVVALGGCFGSQDECVYIRRQREAHRGKSHLNTFRRPNWLTKRG